MWKLQLNALETRLNSAYHTCTTKFLMQYPPSVYSLDPIIDNRDVIYDPILSHIVDCLHHAIRRNERERTKGREWRNVVLQIILAVKCTVNLLLDNNWDGHRDTNVEYLLNYPNHYLVGLINSYMELKKNPKSCMLDLK